MRGVRRVAAFVAIGGAVLTAGCGSLLLPASGPNSIVVRAGVPWNGPSYGLVRLTPKVVNVLDEYGPRTLSAVFGDHRPPPEIHFGIGDVVSVTIFEAAAGGLFIPAEAGVRPGNYVTLPNQPVDTKGFISVPYAGLVPTAGKTPSQVNQEIVDRIKNRAIEPQAVVALVTQNTSLITVIGEVNNENTPSGRIPAQPAGERLLDVITRAGGIRDQGQDMWLVLERHGHRARYPSVHWSINPATTSGLGRAIHFYPLQRAANLSCLWRFGSAGPIPVQRRLAVVRLEDDAGGGVSRPPAD